MIIEITEEEGQIIVNALERAMDGAYSWEFDNRVPNDLIARIRGRGGIAVPWEWVKPGSDKLLPRIILMRISYAITRFEDYWEDYAYLEVQKTIGACMREVE